MRKIKFALVLPLAQLLIAVWLLGWGDQQFCFALNAPALIFRSLTGVADWELASGYVSPLNEVVFLVGVVILWFLVGRELDQHGSTQTSLQRRMTMGKALFNLFLMLFGVYLLWRETVIWLWNSAPLAQREVYLALYWVWSLVLIIVATVNCTTAIRHRSFEDGLMTRKTIPVILTAALVAGLLTLWTGVLEGRFPNFPFPGSYKFWEVLIGADEFEPFLPEPEDGIFLDRAWALGPLFLVINSLTWLPFALSVLYPLHKKKLLIRPFGILILVAGAASVAMGCWEGVAFLRLSLSGDVPFGKNYFLFFASVPSIAVGTIAVFASYGVLKNPTALPAIETRG